MKFLVLYIVNRNEIILAGLVTLGFIITISSFADHNSFDCTQPLFSSTSSCSINGTECINKQTKAGLTGLLDQMTRIVLEEDEDGFTLSCSPDCFIRFSKEKKQAKDTVIQSNIETLQ